MSFIPVHSLEDFPDLLPPKPAGWYLNLYQSAGEAGGTFVPTIKKSPATTFSPNPNSERSKIEGARRAKAHVRRYCVANQLNRMGTLTFAGAGQFDQLALRKQMGTFFKELRRQLGSDLPYLWVPEWHKSHGLHAHFGLGHYVSRSLIESTWSHGFIDIRLIADLGVGSTKRDEARRAANYLGKYVAKSFEDERRIDRLHRYEIAQGFKPLPQSLYAKTQAEVISQANEIMGSTPERTWFSGEQDSWAGAPALWMSWR